MVERIEAGCASVADEMAYVDAPTTHTVQAEAETVSSRPAKALAAFSSPSAEIADVRNKGYLPWLSEQFGAPRAQSAWEWLDSKPYNTAEIDAPRWFGVPDDQLDGILPNLKNFGMTAPSGIAYPRDVGFMG